MDSAPDVLQLFTRALALFATSLDSWFHIPWPIPIAALFLPVVAVLNVVVWYLRGMVFPIPCGYATTKRGLCRRPAIGEWHRCWQHRRSVWRKTDRHLVDPHTPRWENRIRGGKAVETTEFEGRGLLRMRSRQDTLFYHQGFARRPKEVFRRVPAVFRDYKNGISQRWSGLRSLGLSGLFAVTDRGRRQITTSLLLPAVIRATRAALVLVLLGLLFVVVSIAVPTSLGVIFEYCATFSFIFSFSIVRTGIWKANGYAKWVRYSSINAIKWILSLTAFAVVGGLVGLYAHEFADFVEAVAGIVFSGFSFLVFLVVFYAVQAKPKKRRRSRRGRRASRPLRF